MAAIVQGLVHTTNADQSIGKDRNQCQKDHSKEDIDIDRDEINSREKNRTTQLLEKFGELEDQLFEIRSSLLADGKLKQN